MPAGDGIRFRRAAREDLPAIVAMLADDVLGATRENAADPLPEEYGRAFDHIAADPAQELIVAERGGEVIGVLQLTVIASLTWRGTTRALIEGVRIRSDARGSGVGDALVREAIARARARGCGIVQLTTDRTRADAHRFYERLGFRATHVGMKLHLGGLPALVLIAAAALLGCDSRAPDGAGRRDTTTESPSPVGDTLAPADNAAFRIDSPRPGAEWHEGEAYVIRWKRREPAATNVSVAVGGKDRGHIAMQLPAGVDSLVWKIPVGFVTGFGPTRSDAVRIRIEDAADPAVGLTGQPFTIRALAPTD